MIGSPVRPAMLASRAARLSNAGVQNQTTSDSLQQLLEMPRKSWWARLPFGVRMTAGTSALLITIGGGVAGIAALTTSRPDGKRIVTAVGQAADTPPPPAPPVSDVPAPRRDAAKPRYDPAATLPRMSDQADRTGTRPPRPPAATAARTAAEPPPARATRPQAAPARPAPPDTASAKPVLTTRTEVEKRDIPFQTRLVRDPLLPRGARQVRTAGTPGEETLRYLVTYTDGRPTDRKLLDITTTRRPQDRVIAFGSRRGHHGHGPGRRDCRKALDLCVPLGRSAGCREDADTAGRAESTLPGGSVTVLDSDIALLDAQTLDRLPCAAGAKGSR